MTDHRHSAGPPNPLVIELERSSWRRSLATAIRDVESLVRELELPEEYATSAIEAAKSFPVLVPRSFLARMEVGNPMIEDQEDRTHRVTHTARQPPQQRGQRSQLQEPG